MAEGTRGGTGRLLVHGVSEGTYRPWVSSERAGRFRFLLLMAAVLAAISSSFFLLTIYTISELQATKSHVQETSVWQRVPLLLRKWRAQRGRHQTTDVKTDTITRASGPGVAAPSKRKGLAAKPTGGKRAGGHQSVGRKSTGALQKGAAQGGLSRQARGGISVELELRSVVNLASSQWTQFPVRALQTLASRKAPSQVPSLRRSPGEQPNTAGITERGGNPGGVTPPAWQAAAAAQGTRVRSTAGEGPVKTPPGGVGRWIGAQRRKVPPCRAKWRQSLHRHLHKIVLIVNNNFPDIARTTTPFLRRVYGPFFDEIVFIAPQAVPGAGIQARSESPFAKNWYGSYLALEWIVKKYPNAEGYLWTNDDVALNYWKLRGANKSRIWAQRYHGRNFPFDAGQKTEFKDDWPAWPAMRNAAWMAYQALEPKHRTQFEESMLPVRHRYPKRVYDVFYLPHNDSLVLVQKLLPHFARFRLWSEVAVPMMLFALRHPAQYDDVFDSMVYRWEHRENKTLVFDPRHHWNPESAGLHPWKLSKLAARVQFLQTLGALDSCLLTLQRYYV